MMSATAWYLTRDDDDRGREDPRPDGADREVLPPERHRRARRLPWRHHPQGGRQEPDRGRAVRDRERRRRRRLRPPHRCGEEGHAAPGVTPGNLCTVTAELGVAR